MIKTYGPKGVDSAFKEVQANAVSSQPDKRNASRQPSAVNQNLFDNFESERDGSSSPVESVPDYNKVIQEKVNELMTILSKQKKSSENDSLKKQLATAFA